ncbi:hypothetical protein [Bacillus sp. MRMR6]|uniref:hypothetical protein n=1 Tax=Bacillus sp. MRMR6 TaxID=1928617 RepID=UPI0009518041|nr:hypothetical protein [Bacillus sp. MRMR6]OLS41985.1 hypothetical protein BTR25_01040 [Bacillus sp. MRMR6]
MVRLLKVFILTIFVIGAIAEIHLPVLNDSSNVYAEEQPSFFVQYETKNKDLLVQCILTGISFRETNSGKKTGKLIVSVDGKKVQEVTAAAFIVKDLPVGEHKVKLDVVDLNHKPFGLTKEFMVNIPKD